MLSKSADIELVVGSYSRYKERSLRQETQEIVGVSHYRAAKPFGIGMWDSSCRSTPPYIRLSDDFMSRATVAVSHLSPNNSRCRGVVICLLASSHLTRLTTHPFRDCRGGGGLLNHGKELPNHCIVAIPCVLHIVICKHIWLCIGLCLFAIYLK